MSSLILYKNLPLSQTNDVPNFSFDILVDSFLSGKDLKQSSRDSYYSSFVQFKEFLRLYSITQVNEGDIINYKEYLIRKKLSTFTVISHLSAVKSFFSFLERRRLYPDIAKDIRSPKKPRGFSRGALTKEQARELLKSVLGDDVLSQRNRAILSTLLRCGLRSIEIARADIGDVRLCNGTPVLWIHGKGRDGKDEYVVLTKDALKAITDYISLRSSEVTSTDPLFVSHSPNNKNGRLTTRSIRRMVKDHLKKINLCEKEITCHSLRHTFATLALANKAPLLSVQKAMRHSNINTTTIYTHMIDRLTDGAEHYIDI